MNTSLVVGCVLVAFAGGIWLGMRLKPSSGRQAIVPAAPPSAAVTGIGGVFFRSTDPAATTAWYRQHLGLPTLEIGGQPMVIFEWQESAGARTAHTVWSPMAITTEYFDVPQRRAAEFMINYRVGALDALLAKLSAAGISTVGGVQQEFNGRFAWIVDPDGRKVELWEPATGY